MKVVGGSNTTNTDSYDPATGTWAQTGAVLARTEHKATLLPNGNLLVVGGLGQSGLLATADVHDPAQGPATNWFATGSIATARRHHTTTLLPNGKVLLVGGYNGFALASAELYDPAVGSWAATGSLVTARSAHTSTLLPNGKVLIAGGSGSSDSLKTSELYDPASGAWTPTTGNLNVGRSNHTATLLLNGKVLIAGGADSSFVQLASSELYDPATGTWTATASSLANARQNHTATFLPDGKVLVAGGFRNGNYLASSELYDPATGIWTSTGNLNNARQHHTATRLPDGRVLVAGGSTTGYLASSELYDSTAGTWTPTTSPLNVARQHHTATLLPNGKVLAAGGGNGSGDGITSAELFNPATGTWASTGSLPIGRMAHTATLLPNGKVLTAAGRSGTNIVASTDLYDPEMGTWMTTGALKGLRWFHTATLLPDGHVLVAAGAAGTGSTLAGAELYDVGLGFSGGSRPVINSATSPLQLTTFLFLTGTRFQGVSGSSSDGTQSSSTNYPVVQLRSLVNEQTFFLPPIAFVNWSDTSFVSEPVPGFPRGYALVTVFTNGIPSESKLIQVTKIIAVFSNLSAPTIAYGDTPTTLSGKITYNGNFPTGNVAISLNGVTQQAAIQVGGTFSSSFATGVLGVLGSPYAITYSYSGDAYYESATDSSKTLTVNKATPTTVVSSSVNPSEFGQSVTFTATVTSSAGTPSGSVQFKDAGVNVGSAQTLNAGGVAQLTISSLTSGTHSISAEYLGNDTWTGSTGTLQGGQVVKPQPTLSINDVSVTEGNSGTANLTFTVTLSAASNLTVSAGYSTANGTATTADSDYQLTSGTMTFTPGDLTETVTVLVNADQKTEPDETVFIVLSNPVNVAFSDSQGQGTILNDDTLQLLLDTSGPDANQLTALSSLLLVRDQFRVQNIAPWFTSDQNTRVILFALNLQLGSGESPSVVKITLVDGNGQPREVAADDVRAIPNTTFTQVTFRLPDALAAGTYLVTIKAHGRISNTGMFRIVQ